MSRVNSTKYDKYDAQIITAIGKAVHTKVVSFETGDYLEQQNGTIVRKNVDFSITLTTNTETLHTLTALAAAAGSWQDIEALPFINIDVTPPNGIPYIISCVNCTPQIQIAEINKIEGGVMDQEIKFLVGDILVNGVPVLREREQNGI